MIIRSRAPIRIDLAGGWTDVPPFADREGGAAVNVAISRYAHAVVRRRDDASIRLRSEDYATGVAAASIDALRYDGRLDLLKAAIKRQSISHGLDLTTQSDAPPGSGLGTSAALAVAVLGALEGLAGKEPDRSRIAALAHLLEVEELGIAGGKQDQQAAAWGGINALTFGPGLPERRPLAVAAGVAHELERRLVLCYSGVSRLSGDIIQRVQQAYMAGDPQTCAALRGMVKLAEATADALLAGAIDDLGAILRENWRCQRALHPSVTNAGLDDLFEVAEAHGALGGKACGAGGGGCVVFLAAIDGEHSLRHALAEAGAQLVSFNIDQAGLQTWTLDEATGRVVV
jgi:D-glycero-alpha-D-manno-heptose-7-phosphate kinase